MIPLRAAALWLICLAPALPAGGAHDVWMDVDPAIGLEEAEVDDGLALIQAFHSPELSVRGVSVVFGNAELDQAFPVAREVVSRFGLPGLEVAPGAASAADLGRETPAVRAMARALEEAPLTILALGPVTNVATLLKLHPGLQPRVRSIVCVAARRPGQRFLTGRPSNPPHRDINFELDPEAMAVLLGSSVPLVFAPWEVSSHVWITETDLDELSAESESGAWVARNCRSWLARWRRDLGVDGFNPFDTLAVGWMSHPELIETFQAGVEIVTGPDDRAGADQRDPPIKPYLLARRNAPSLRPATYCFRPSPEFKTLLIRRLASRPDAAAP